MAASHDNWNQLKHLFAEACELPVEQRETFARAHCDDPTLLTELLELLSHEASAPEGGDEAFLESPIGARSNPKTIADYRLGRVLGSGGMGTVYEAHQDTPHRTVALKLLHPLAMSESATRRFETEAEILARLQHPAIAQVFATGTHDADGAALPWFAMELVPDAVPITTFCRSSKLPLRERLELFVQICDAVHHGHQKGVVHRDLKPGNVLVAGTGQPKVIDFGVARVTDSDIERATMRTTAGELIGTLAYMSPEQCRAEPDGIDGRSDVYALGVILYELMTGALPYETEGLALPAALRVVTDGAPRRCPELPTDLEAIAFKAMEKEPRRRYESAAAFAADVQRYLRSEPVTARAPSFTYHLRLMARRHRALFLAAGTVLVVLAVATGVSSLFAVEAKNRADEAAGERDGAVQTLAILEGAIRSANPFVEQRDVTVSELLEGVARRIERGEVERADVRIRLHRAIGACFRGLGRTDEALHHLEAALQLLAETPGNRRTDRHEILVLLAAANGDKGNLEQAAAQAGESVAIIEELHGSYSSELVAPLSRLGSYLHSLGQIPAAKANLERAIAIGTNSSAPDTDSSLGEAFANLGTLAWQEGDKEGGAKLWERALERLDRSISRDHPLAARTRNNYGMYLQAQKRFDEAEAMFTTARDQLSELRGPESPDVANAELKLGFLFVDTGELDRAETAFRRGLEIRRKCFGNDARYVPRALQGLAYFYLQNQRWQDAATLLEEALTLSKNGLPDKHPSLAGTRVLLGRALTGAGQAAAAEPHLRRSLEVRLEAYGAESFQVAAAQSALGHCLLRLDRRSEAEPLLRDSLPVIEAAVGAGHTEARAARARIAELDK